LEAKDSPSNKRANRPIIGGEDGEGFDNSSFGMPGIENKVTCGDLMLFIALRNDIMKLTQRQKSAGA